MDISEPLHEGGCSVRSAEMFFVHFIITFQADKCGL